MNHPDYPIGQKKRIPKLLKNKGTEALIQNYPQEQPHPPETQEKYKSRILVTEDGMKTGINERCGGGKESIRNQNDFLESRSSEILRISRPTNLQKERKTNLPQFPIGFAKEKSQLPKRRKVNINLPAFPLGKILIKRPRKTRIPNRKLPQYPIGKKWVKRVIVPRSHKISIFSDTPISRSGFMQIAFDSTSIIMSRVADRDPDDPIIENIGINVNALVNMFTFAPSPDD